MPKRPRRSSIKYIENNKSRSISFFKRRGGLFKIAATLSTLTGARVAIVVEAENGKMSSFGAPSFGPIMDSFLSGEQGAPEGPHEHEKDQIAKLQSKLMQLEENKSIQEKRTAESLARIKEIQESSRMGKLIYSKVDDLCADELNELLRGLEQTRQEIRALLLPPRVEINGFRGPPPSWLSFLPQSQVVQRLPRRLPWVSSQLRSSLPFLRSPHIFSQSIMTNFTHMSLPVQPSSLQAVSQAYMMPLPNEVHQYNYQSQGVAITGNASGHFSQTSLLPSLAAPLPPTSTLQISSQRSVAVETPFQSLNLNQYVPLQNHANPHLVLENNEVSCFFSGTSGITPTHPFAGYQQEPSLIPCGANGGHHATGGHNVPCSSSLNGNAYEWLSKTLLESNSEGGSSSDAATGDSLVDMEWLADN